MADSVDLPFRAEYAKSNRSSCKMCKNKIEKGELRMAAMVQVRASIVCQSPISIYLATVMFCLMSVWQSLLL